MEVKLLGSMQVVADDGSPVDCGGPKQRAVLAQLALDPNHTVSVDRLAEGVWGERVPPHYRQNLQVYVSTLRRALEPDRPAGSPSRIVGHGEGYELVAAVEEIDVSRFRGLLTEAADALTAGRPKAAAEHCATALDEWRGDPLADLVGVPFAAEWLEPLHRDRLRGRELRAEANVALAQHQAALPELEELVEQHPDHEHLWELLVTALARAGRQADALDALRRATRYLSQELGLDPGPALAELAERVLHQDPALMGSRPPAIRAEPVPVPLSPSIGREEVITATADALDSHRLVVVTGPGGVGKTRTAQEALARRDTDGVRWVSFAAEPGTASVTDNVARALGVAPDSLGDRLDEEPTLLALDNLEHVVNAPKEIRELLEAHRTTRVLATSRGPLGLPGEHVVPVPLLDPRTTARQLFVERAGAVVPGYTGASDADAVVQLCELLDGLPLAIELAAARVATLPPTELLGRLPRTGDVSSAAPSGRQSSLTSLVRWSLDLLRPAERVVLEALSVLDGPPDRRTASAVVAAATGEGPTRADPLLAIEALVRHALVQPLESRSGRRFGLLHTVRAVCLTDLETAGPADPGGVTTAAARRHAALLAVADLWLEETDRVDFEEHVTEEFVAGVQDDLPILRQVVEELVGNQRPDRATALLGSRRRALALLGRQDVLLDLMRSVLAMPRPGPWLPRAQIVAGSAAYVVEGPQVATPLLAAVDQLDPSDTVHRVLAHCFRAVIASECGDDDAARAEGDLAISVATEAGHRGMRLRAHSAAAWAATNRGDAAEVVRLGRIGLDLAVDDTEAMSTLVDIARGHLMADAPGQAVPFAQEAVRRSRRIGTGYVLCDALQMLGFSLVRDGQLDDGRGVLAESIRHFAPSDLGWQLETIAGIALATVAGGPDVEAERLLQDATRAAVRGGLGDSAVPMELEPLAARLSVDPVGVAVGPAPSIAELRDRALACGRAPAQDGGLVRATSPT